MILKHGDMNEQQDFEYQNPPHNSPHSDYSAQLPEKYSSGTPGDQNAAVLAHVVGPIASLVSAGTLAMVAPLVAWLIFRTNSPYAARHAANAFNFQFLMWLGSIIGVILTITIVGAIIGIPLLIVCPILSIVFGIIAAVKTSNGEDYRYPFQLTILK